MASFVIHNIAAENFLKLLGEEYGIELSESDRDRFLMANLIVDSSRLKRPKDSESKEERKAYKRKVQEEKVSTHFRSTEDANLCIQTPVLTKFEEKYQSQLGTDLAYLGYLFHLYTDKTFFEDLFPKTFDTLDENMQPTIYSGETKNMFVKKNNKVYSIEEFWDSKSQLGIYNDYTVMNKLLLEHYGSTFDIERLQEASASFQNPGIEEVDFENIGTVLAKTAAFIKESYEAGDSTLNIFDKQQVIDFIDENAKSFVSQYQHLLPKATQKVHSKAEDVQPPSKKGE